MNLRKGPKVALLPSLICTGAYTLKREKHVVLETL